MPLGYKKIVMEAFPADNRVLQTLLHAWNVFILEEVPSDSFVTFSDQDLLYSIS